RASRQLDRRDDLVSRGIYHAQGVVGFDGRKQPPPIPLDRQPMNSIGQTDVIYSVQRLQVDDADVVTLAVVHVQPDVLSRRCPRPDLETQKEEEKGRPGTVSHAPPPIDDPP